MTIYLARRQEPKGVKMVDGRRVEYLVYEWVPEVPLVLGTAVRAYRPDGKVADRADVLKALSKSTGVACFVQYGNAAAVPDLFFLQTLREGSVALAFLDKDTKPQAPKK